MGVTRRRLAGLLLGATGALAAPALAEAKKKPVRTPEPPSVTLKSLDGRLREVERRLKDAGI